MLSNVRSIGLLLLVVLAVSSCGRGRASTRVPPTDATTTKFWILEHQRAERVANLIREHLGSDELRVSCDRVGNQILTTGSIALTKRAGELVRNLDIESYTSDWPIYTYYLRNRRAIHVESTMRQLGEQLAKYRSADPHDVSYPAMSVHADVQSNALIFCGLREDFHALKMVLDELDVE